jgi:hypothetical protein
MPKDFSIDMAYEAARGCILAFSELVNYRDLSEDFPVPDGCVHDDTLEPFQRAIEHLRQSATILADVYPGVSDMIVKTRAQRGGCTFCGIAAHTAHETSLKLAKEVLTYLSAFVLRRLDALEPDAITDQNLPLCYKYLSSRADYWNILEVDRLLIDIQWEHEQAATPLPVTPDTGLGEGNDKADVNRQKKRINARMLEIIQQDQNAMGWNSTQWATCLKCAKSSVVETQAWKDLTMGRERIKAEKVKDRRRRLKASDLNRD